MPLIIPRRTIWTPGRPPSHPARIARHDRLTDGLIYAPQSLAGVAYDPVSGLIATSSDRERLKDVVNNAATSPTGAYTIYMNRRVAASGSGARSFFVARAAYSSGGIYHYINSGGSYQLEHWNGSIAAANTSLGGDDKDDFFIVFNGSSTIDFYLFSGGATLYTFSNSSFGAYGTGGSAFGINSTDGGQSVSSDFVLVWNRALSDAERKAIRANTRRIYEPFEEVVGFSTGGGAFSLSAPGSSTTSGSATASVAYSLGAIGVSASGGNAAPRVAFDLEASHVSVTTGDAQPTVTATLGASALVQSAGTAGLRPDVLVEAAGSALSNGNATLALQALHAAAGSATINGNATMAALINEAAAGVITTEGITALQAAIAALASGSSTTTGGATLSGGPAGSLNASGGSTTVGAANLDITLSLNASGTDTTAGNVDPISLAVALTAAGLIQAVGAGFLVISAPLEAFGAVATGGAASIVNGNVIVVIPAARRFGSRVVGFRPAALQARRRPSAH